MYIPRIQKNNLLIFCLKKANKVYLILASIIFLVLSNTALAQGVLAGIDISNKVTVTYSIAGEDQSPIESSPTGNKSPGVGNGQSTIFKVDRKIDLTLTNNGNTNVTLGETHAALYFTLSNDGNDSQEFLLSVDSTLATDNFDTHNCRIKVTSVTGTPLPGVVLPTFNAIKLSPDQQASISVECDIPFDNNGQAILKDHTSLLSLKAITNKNSDGNTTVEDSTTDSASNIETVYADSAGSDDANRDASHSARATYITLDASAPVPPTFNINKAIINVIDPQGGNQSISGSSITYKIVILTTGTGVINNVVITDPTPANMTYKLNSITLNGLALTDQSDTDEGEFNTSNNTTTINLGDIIAGTQQEIQISYTIN